MSASRAAVLAPVLALFVGCVGAVRSESARVEPRAEPADPAQVAYARGLAARAAGRYQTAIAAFQLAVSEDPFRYDAHYQMGVCYYELGEYGLELLEYRKCLAINESYPRVWRELGHAAFLADDLETARVAYTRYLGTERDPLCVYNLALVQSDLGHGAEAMDLLKEYLAQRPGSPDLRGRATRRLEELSRLAERGRAKEFPRAD